MALAVSYSFSPTTTIESGQVNQNFTDIVNYINNTASPAGLVCAWKGSIASIPTGWTLDTDLRDKMIIGAGNLYAYADTGGEATHVLLSSEMPSHTHVQDAHTHAGTLTSKNADGTGSTRVREGDTSGASGGVNYTTGSATATNQNTGGGGAHNNLPPYYALAFIRRT